MRTDSCSHYGELATPIPGAPHLRGCGHDELPPHHVRITDPAKSRAFYEALGFRLSNEMDIVRNGELEATNYFFSLGDQQNVLEQTYNHDGRSYELGTATGTSLKNTRA